MTPAQRFLASLYEKCVDADMDTEQIRRYLLSQGVAKTPGQVAWELEHTYGFYRYAETHQPRPEPTVAEWDKAIDRGIIGSRWEGRGSVGYALKHQAN